ncbi:MAG TPA: DUF177 domain-containing protein [Candidatus Sulfotelmatobacter sp.]|jgi:uncharacterized metal-binding protein YceD (DUF177 family)|nr:DUF177 domain-containing protein [Candidatus Sulfotelmatobacter sp.]
MILEDDGIAPEFSRPILVDSLSVAERTYEIEATEDECRVLAERFGILSIQSLSATVRLRVLPGGDLVRARGSFTAAVHQACVVTLEPVPEAIEESFELLYGPEPDEESEEIVVDLEVTDPPEPIINNSIDIGEAVAEHLALALDPFPRAPGAEFVEVTEEEAPEPEEKPNPFAVLAALKKK